MEDTLRVASMTRLRIGSDGEGVRTVAFLYGCPLNCFWCCNPETRFGDGYRELTQEQLYDCIRRDIPYFRATGGGITFSGGEPLIQARSLIPFIRERCEGFGVDLETSLQGDPEDIRALAGCVGQWNVDMKCPDPERHRRYTGMSHRRILENLRLLAELVPPERILITYPMIPGFNDRRRDLRQMADIMEELGLTQLEIHPYRSFAEQKHRALGRPVTHVRRTTAWDEWRARRAFEKRGICVIRRSTCYGHAKCDYLKSVRQTLIREHDVDLTIPECPYKGPCLGTCPVCEGELEFIGRSIGTLPAGDPGIPWPSLDDAAGEASVDYSSLDPLNDFFLRIDRYTEPPKKL